MKMRKIISVLAAVLMLCSMLPLGALSVSAANGDVVVNYDFNDGVAHFERGVVQDGYMVFDATTANWQNAFEHIAGIKANTMYNVSFKAKANKDANLSFKINNNWSEGGDTVNESVAVTTEWQEYELTINSGDLTAAIVMFASGYEAAHAPIYNIDDVLIVETVDPALIGKVVNGDFANGSDGWNLGAGASIVDGALQLSNPSQWAEAAMQTIPVEANAVYTMTWKSKRVSGSDPFNLILYADGANLPTVEGKNWMNETSGNWVDNTYTVSTGASTSMLIKWTTEASNAGVILIDDIVLTKVKQPSDDGFIKNGDFETGKATPWTTYSGSNVNANAAFAGEYGLQLIGDGGWGGLAYQDFTVEVGKTYVVSYTIKTPANGVNIQAQTPAGTNVKSTWVNGISNWTTKTLEFTATDTNARLNISGGGNGLATDVYMDEIFIFEKKDISNDGYIINGTFETGDLAPWENLWGSCTTAIVRGGKDSNFALNVVSGEWKHVRQTNIAVEANTDYKITAWAKNANNMSLLVKNGGDSVDIKNVGVSAGDEWTQFTAEFNSGEFTTIIFSLMGGAGEGQYGTFDNIVMEKVEPACEHVYNYACDEVCSICGEANPNAGHTIVHVDAKAGTDCQTWDGNIEYWYCSDCNIIWADEACTMQTNYMNTKVNGAHAYDGVCDEDCNVCLELNPNAHQFTDGCDDMCDLCDAWRPAPHNLTIYHEGNPPANCLETGHDEYWECADCGALFADEEAMMGINPAWLNYTGECTRPEGAAHCANVACSVCGEMTNGDGAHTTLYCQGGVCEDCGDTIEGWGCANYTTPACMDGVCDYCGGFVAGYGHENGGMYACCEGECGYDCGLTYPATAHHVDADANGFCDVCRGEYVAEENEHVYDDDADTTCNVCGEEREIEQPPVEVVYGDANGDGKVNSTDEILLAQFNAGWDVELDMTAADANGDGKVNSTDEILLAQFNAGWDVTLGPV